MKFVCGDIRSMLPEDDTVESVVFLDTLDYSERHSEIFDNVRNWVKPFGAVVFVVPINTRSVPVFGLRGADITSPEKMHEILADHFVIENVDIIGSHVVIAVCRLL